MRVLVTGGAGFIGSHLCDRLLAEGHEVIAMDNLVTGSTDNIAHLAGHPRFRFIFHDVTNYIYIDGPLDAILHLASLPSPVDYLEKPIQTLKVGALGTHKTLGLAVAKGARYLLASTSEVYGDPKVHPQPETYWGNVNPVGPRGVYDESKRFAEAMTMAYHRAHGVDTRIARIFNTYGPRMRLDDGRVVPNFVKQALLGEPLTVYDDGSRTRSFCVHADEYIPVIGPDGVLEIHRLGDWADKVLEESCRGLKLNGYMTVCLDSESRRVKLGRLSHISRRRSRERMLEITLRWGKQCLRVTEKHPLLVWQKGKWVQKEARELVVGDELPVALAFPKPHREVVSLNLIREFMTNLSSNMSARIFVRNISKTLETLCNKTGLSFAQLHARLQLHTSYDQIIGRESISLPDFVRLMEFAGLEGPSPELTLGFEGGHFELPAEFQLMPGFMRLLGYFVADGNYNTSRELGLVFTNEDERILSDIRNILTKLGVHYTESICSSGIPQITVTSKMLHLLFRDVFRIDGKEKGLPKYLYNMPLPLISEFLKAYLSGDGWVVDDKEHSSFRVGLTSFSPRLLREMAFLFTMLGMPGAMTKTRFSIGGREMIERFAKLVSFIQEERNEAISDYLRRVHTRGAGNRLLRRQQGEVALNRVVSIREIKSSEFVYDLQVEPDHSFALCTNGAILVHNCYISDMVDGLYRLLLSDEVYPVNLGNPREITILELAHKVLEISGSSSKITFVTPTDERTRDDPQTRQPDISKARRLLGWEPKVSLEEGLHLTIEWFRQRIQSG